MIAIFSKDQLLLFIHACDNGCSYLCAYRDQKMRHSTLPDAHTQLLGMLWLNNHDCAMAPFDLSKF